MNHISKTHQYRLNHDNLIIVIGKSNRGVKHLFLDEFGEETLGLSSGDVAAVIAPDEDATFDVEQKQRGGRPCHVVSLGLRDIRSDQTEDEI